MNQANSENNEAIDIAEYLQTAKKLTERKESILRRSELATARMEPYLKELDALREEMQEHFGTDNPDEIEKILQEQKKNLMVELEEVESQCAESEQHLKVLEESLGSLA